jgi:hypothetical protein
MSAPKVLTFFYGSFINLDVLAQVDFVPERHEVARIGGYDIVIRPLANLVRADERCVFGIVAGATHAELDVLYAHAREVLGGEYLPHPVIVDITGGTLRAALCYIAPEMPAKLVDDDYLDRIVVPAKQYGFPEWYIERLESFRS